MINFIDVIHAQEQNQGSWIRQAPIYPQGLTVSTKHDKARFEGQICLIETYTSHVKLDGSIDGSYGDKKSEGHYEWQMEYALPETIEHVASSFNVEGVIRLNRIKSDVRHSGHLAMWVEDATGIKLGKGQEISFFTDEELSAKSNSWQLPFPSAPTNGDRFNLVVRTLQEWGATKMSVVYPFIFVGEAGIQVDVQFEDKDDQFTLADQAKLKITIRNNTDQRLENVAIQFDLDQHVNTLGLASTKLRSVYPHLLEEPAIKIIDPSFNQPKTETLLPQQKLEYTYRIKSGNENNLYIFDRLIRGGVAGGIDETQKPETEVSYSLEKAIGVKIQLGENVFVEGLYPIRNGEHIVAIGYPDFKSIAGVPPDRQAHQYYYKGDIGRRYVGNSHVRAIAVRAARYEQADRHIPENNPQQVAVNLARYVHQAFMPKFWPENIEPPHTVAKELFKNLYGPDKPRTPIREGDKKGFPCIEHAFMLNTLARSLGFAARAVNCLEYVDGKIYNRYYQDASNQIYCNGKWEYFSLFGHDGQVCRTPQCRYQKPGWTYELWIGTRPFPEYDNWTRFEMMSLKMYNSSFWKFWGYGDKDGFEETDDPPLLSWTPFLGPLIYYNFFSPVQAIFKYDDGQVIGMENEVTVTDQMSCDFFFGNRVIDGKSIVDKGAAWLPEGLVMSVPNEEGFLTNQPIQQLLVVPAGEDGEMPKGELILTGIGDGPWRMESFHVNAEGIQQLETKQGHVVKGEHIRFDQSSFQPIGKRQPHVALQDRPSEMSSASTTVPRDRQRPVVLGVSFVNGNEVKPNSRIDRQTQVVSRVYQETPAARAGVQVRDRIEAVDGVPITSSTSIKNILSAKKFNDEITIHVNRNGRRLELKARLNNENDDVFDQITYGLKIGTDYNRLPVLYDLNEEHGYRIAGIASLGNNQFVLGAQTVDNRFQHVKYFENLDDFIDWNQEIKSDNFYVRYASIGHSAVVGVAIYSTVWKDQRVELRQHHRDILQLIEQYWDNGYFVSDLDYGMGYWMAIFSKVDKPFGQYYFWNENPAHLPTTRDDLWQAGRKMTNFAHSDQAYICLATPVSAQSRQTLIHEVDEKTIQNHINTLRNSGHTVDFVSSFGDRWFLGFSSMSAGK